MALIADTLDSRSGGAQYKLVASGSVVQGAATLGAANADVKLFELPANAMITACHLFITTLFDGTTPTLTIEQLELDGSDLAVSDSAGSTTAVVLDSAQAATAVGRWTTASAHHPSNKASIVTIKNTATNSTVGACTVEVEYYVQGRSNENTG